MAGAGWVAVPGGESFLGSREAAGFAFDQVCLMVVGVGVGVGVVVAGGGGGGGGVFDVVVEEGGALPFAEPTSLPKTDASGGGAALLLFMLKDYCW